MKVIYLQIPVLLGNVEQTEIIKQAINPITHFTFWDKIIKRYKLQAERKILNWVAYDPNFQPGLYNSRFKPWTEKGITTLCIILEEGKCMSFQELRGKFGLEKNRFFSVFFKLGIIL